MATYPVIDFSYARFTVDQLSQFKAAGGTGVVRYIDEDSPAKALSAAERDLYWSLGLTISLVYENHANDYLGGFSKGLACGRFARAGARALGWPDSVPVIFGGYDTGDQMNPANRQTCIDFMRGYNEGGGCGPQPAYAGSAMIDTLFNAGLIPWGWHAAASSWSPNGVSSHAHIRQTTAKPFPFMAASSYDANEVLHPDYGQHGKAAAEMTPEEKAYFDAKFAALTTAVAGVPTKTLAATMPRVKIKATDPDIINVQDCLRFGVANAGTLVYALEPDVAAKSTNVLEAVGSVDDTLSELATTVTNLDEKVNVFIQGLNLAEFKDTLTAAVTDAIAGINVTADVDVDLIANAVADRLAQRLLA